MTRGTREGPLRLWGALNVSLLILVLGYGGVFTLLIILLGTDHSETYVDEWASRWLAGAAIGLLTALLAGRYDRRYLPWTAALMLTGVLAASLASTAYRGVPLGAVGVLLAASMVLHARAGRDRTPVSAPRRQLRTGVLVTLSTVGIIAATAVFVAVNSRPTPLYDAMRTDPMAADRLPGMAVRFDYSKDQTTPFGVPSAAKVSRLWTITDGSTSEQKRAELAELAGRSGWTDEPGPVPCDWRKTVGGYPLCLVIQSPVSAGGVMVEITQVD